MTWFKHHRNKSRQDESTPLVRHDSKEMDHGEHKTKASRSASDGFRGAARPAASKTSSRISIERYLKAPLDEEPASIPAISAALRMPPRNATSSPASPTKAPEHSADSSGDAGSDGRRTFYTSGSNRDSTITSYTIVSRTNRSITLHQRTGSDEHHARPSSSGTTRVERGRRETVLKHTTAAGSAQSLQQHMEQDFRTKVERYIPSYSFLPTASNPNHHANLDDELTRIQTKAKSLEERLRAYQTRASSQSPDRVTDELALAQVAARPKLAWILGEESSIPERPKSSGAVEAASINGEALSSASRTSNDNKHKSARKSRSNESLGEKSRGRVHEKRTGMILERRHSRRPRFFCTFCEKRFPNRAEWIRHEQATHMPEELWICCPRTGEFPARCPFCHKSQPSPAHLAEHNYLTCQARPLGERTFNKQDHFLQHISQVHKVSTWQKPQRLTELLDAWRHPLPLKEGHLALHCGFCGRTFPTYAERTEHVATHFTAGLDMMSWWSRRISHDIDPVPASAERNNAKLPHKCGYCERTFENLADAQTQHPICTMWSCSFLPGMPYAIYPVARGDHVEAACCYCNEAVVAGIEKVRIPALKEHLTQHNFRNCNQRLYFSGQRFRQHLQDSHKSNHDGTLFAGWTLLLRSSRKQKPSVFQPVEDAALVRRAFIDPLAGGGREKKSVEIPQMPKANFMEFSENALKSPMRKLKRKDSTRSLPEQADDAASNSQQRREVRSSQSFFSRAATSELVYGSTMSTTASQGQSPPFGPTKGLGHRRKTSPTSISAPVSLTGRKACLRFYRRRLDASTRNRMYVRDAADPPLSKNSQRLFRRVPASMFGELVLHSSLIGAVPARMTNSVDVYYIH